LGREIADIFFGLSRQRAMLQRSLLLAFIFAGTGRRSLRSVR
jgi:hypothetical protein